MVFENYALYPHKTVFDNVANPLKLAKVGAQEITERVKRATELLEIDHLLDRRPQELSGGQKQRVAIGRAIVRQPQVFLFDEPIAHLDAKLRARMRSELKRLQVDLGVTSLYVTHDQLEALSMADRVAVMHEGVLQQYDTPQTIYEKPANAWVATNQRCRATHQPTACNAIKLCDPGLHAWGRGNGVRLCEGLHINPLAASFPAGAGYGFNAFLNQRVPRPAVITSASPFAVGAAAFLTDI